MKQSAGNCQDVPVKRVPIELCQFLKLAQVVATGGEAKTLVQNGEVQVNGVLETRRSRQLQVGDVVGVAGQVNFRVTDMQRELTGRLRGAN